MTSLKLSDFQIDDRVQVVDYELETRKDIHLHQLGTVVGFDGDLIIVDHDEPFCGDLDSYNGMVKSGNGWGYFSSELEIIVQDAHAPVDDLL